MEGIFKKLSSVFARLNPVVIAADSEEELVDPQVVLRDDCEKKECSNFLEKLNTCNSRVLSKKKTSETCDEEMIDFIECLDDCVSKTLFSKLK